MSRRRDVWAACGALLVALVVLSLGFHSIGPPSNQRAIAADFRRATDLFRVANRIYARRSLGLPEHLEDLGDDLRLKDPVTGKPYEYHPKAGTAYELCASFARESIPPSEWDFRDGGPRPRPFSKHPAGRHCFQLDASQQLFWGGSDER